MSYCTCDVCSGTASQDDNTVEIKVRVTFQEDVVLEVPRCEDMDSAIDEVVCDVYSAVDVVDWEEV